MATKKQTTSKTRTSSRAAKKSAAQAKAALAAQEKKQAMLRSVILFAVGLLFVVMLFVQGASAWGAVRTFLFGVFGISFYFAGVALLYIAVLVAQQAPWLGKTIKIVLGMATLCGTAILFSSVEVEGLGFGSVVALFYQNGALSASQVSFGGGVLGLLLGAPLLALCGRPAANILMVILFLCAVMLLTGISPAEIAAFVEKYLGSAKEHGDHARESLSAKQAECAAARAARAEQEAQEEAEYEIVPEDVAAPKMPTTDELELDAPVMIPVEEEEPNEAKPWYKRFARPAQVEEPAAPASAPRAFFDIDLGPSPAQVQGGMSEPIEPIAIGPGGTFGLEAVRGVASVPLADFADPSASTPPEADGFWQVPVEEENAPDGVIGVASATAVAADAAAGVLAASGVAGVPSDIAAATAMAGTSAATAATAAQFPAQDGWVSMSDSPAADGASSDGTQIAELAAAAMDKPLVADAALSGVPAAEIETEPSYQYPSIELFDHAVERQDKSAQAELQANAQKLVETLESFGVKTRVLDISRGPSVTRYELQPLAGVKISRITNLADDIALNLAVAGVRMEAPIPGKPAVGIEVPNRRSVSVAMRSLLVSKNYTHMESPLTFALGKDIAGVAQVGDLCKMPHLLVAGSTGSGKSVCINSIIISFLFRASPEELKMILIDPKMVELAEYNGIPHLLMPVVTEARKAAGALGSAVAEMEKRYRLFADNNVRDIKTYNKLAENTEGMEKIPYIAIVIDELADLMMVAGKEVEDYICRIAQKARAAGMHLIVATQRPSVDVITGLIKANVPSRISFAVSSQIDSRTILDAAGAEKLLGMGDMLYLPVGASKPVRIQGTYVKDEEISRVLNFIKQSASAQYDEEMIAEMEKVAANQKGAAGAGGGASKGDSDDGDPMLKQCAEVVIEAGQASTSLLQRRCKLGYARAARIMDEMEQLRIIGPYEGAKPRAVLVSRQQWLEMCMNEQDNAPEQTTLPTF